MDLVPGVAQKPLFNFVPQESNTLQLPVQPAWSQNATFVVAERQLVPGALRQVAPPVYTVQGPEQSPAVSVLQ